MLGYEKVNRTVKRPPGLVVPLRRPQPRLIDLSALAAETPGESIAHENEIVAMLALADDYAERPSAHCIAEQLQGLVDPGVIRNL